MNKRKIILVKFRVASFLLFTCFIADAQFAGYLGTKTPYHHQQLNYTPAPAGYKPVFINYVGRHGARFLTGTGSDVLVKDILQQAQKQQALTIQGKNILAQLLRFDALEKNNYGNITMLGKQEQHNIAERMQQQYPSVFQQKKLRVEMTEKIRTQQSASAFLSGIKNYNSSLIEAIVFPGKSDSILRFYDLSPDYDAYVKSDAVKAHIDSLQTDINTKNNAVAVCKKVFTNSFIQQLNNGTITSAVDKENTRINVMIVTQALYDVYCILFSAAKELEADKKPFTNSLQNIFTESELKWFDEINAAEDFYAKGPAEDTSGIQVTIAAPLLRDLLVTTDSSIQTKNYDGIFRFTHAEAISPLAALMGIPQACHITNSVYTFSNNWKASEIIPLSANIQWIIYCNGNDYLIKVLLNEKEAALPVPASTFPYYSWSAVKDYYFKKLSYINSIQRSN